MPVITDTFGNHFLGTYITPEGSINTQMGDLMDDAVGAANNDVFTSGTEILVGWRPDPVVETNEQLADAISISSLTGNTIQHCRFGQFIGEADVSAPNTFGYLRTDNDDSTSNLITDLITFTATAGETAGSKTRNWATASARSLGIFLYTDADNYHFSYAGILNNAPGYVYPTNSVIITLGRASATDYGDAIRIGAIGGSTSQDITVDANSNYSTVCQNGATIPTATEVYFRDDNAGLNYPAVGYGDNLVFARGAFTIGDPYFVEDVDTGDIITSDPILGSTFRFFICVGQMGADYILMRVGQ